MPMGVLDVQLLVIYNVSLDVTLVHLALDNYRMNQMPSNGIGKK